MEFFFFLLYSIPPSLMLRRWILDWRSNKLLEGKKRRDDRREIFKRIVVFFLIGIPLSAWMSIRRDCSSSTLRLSQDTIWGQKIDTAFWSPRERRGGGGRNRVKISATAACVCVCVSWLQTIHQLRLHKRQARRRRMREDRAGFCKKIVCPLQRCHDDVKRFGSLVGDARMKYSEGKFTSHCNDAIHN